MREEGTVARVGGDEFLVLLRGVKHRDEAAIAASRIMETMNQSFMIQGQTLNMSRSIGVSIFPERGEDSETLTSHADTAMYLAKEEGRCDVRLSTAI